MKFYQKQIFDHLSWFFSNILLPLSPVIVSAIIIWIDSGNFSWSSIDPAVLSFAMIMLCYVTLAKLHGLDDKDLKSGLTVIYYLLIILLFAPFILSISSGIQNENSSTRLIENITHQTISSNSVEILSQMQTFSNSNNQYIYQLEHIRLLAVILSVIAIVLSFICKCYWKIGSGIYGD